MSNEYKDVSGHSAERFGDTRTYWWNEDFLRMIVHRWPVGALKHGLDVGCGVGHWGRQLASVLPDLELVGIDREVGWVEAAERRAQQAGLEGRLRYRQGAAEAIPFDDDCFDLVTCQTLLIHVASPPRALAEMVRVLKPGGTLLVAEPTNIAPTILDSLAIGDAPATTSSLLAFQLYCVKGKAQLGEGNDLLGESLPLLLRGAALTDVEIRNNDRTWPLVPPYATAVERAQIEDLEDALSRDRWIWDRETTQRYFVAGGGPPGEFSELWALATDSSRRVLEGFRRKSLTSAGGTLFYLAWGRKPVQALRAE